MLFRQGYSASVRGLHAEHSNKNDSVEPGSTVLGKRRNCDLAGDRQKGPEISRPRLILILHKATRKQSLVQYPNKVSYFIGPTEKCGTMDSYEKGVLVVDSSVVVVSIVPER